MAGKKGTRGRTALKAGTTSTEDGAVKAAVPFDSLPAEVQERVIESTPTLTADAALPADQLIRASLPLPFWLQSTCGWPSSALCRTR
jgi:hypothetical protein